MADNVYPDRLTREELEQVKYRYRIYESPRSDGRVLYRTDVQVQLPFITEGGSSHWCWHKLPDCPFGYTRQAASDEVTNRINNHFGYLNTVVNQGESVWVEMDPHNGVASIG